MQRISCEIILSVASGHDTVTALLEFFMCISHYCRFDYTQGHTGIGIRFLGRAPLSVNAHGDTAVALPLCDIT